MTLSRIEEIIRLYAYCILLLLCYSNAKAEYKTFDYIVGYKTVEFAGEKRQAIAVNGQIPGPILHAKEGDHVTINVHNNLNEGTTIHWHGLLVPWKMDGVKGVNQDAIPPGETFKYEFILRQAGTYWYHAHTGLQEQSGLYGGIIIDPMEPEPYEYTKDHVIVLSDWINTSPHQVLDNLKKEGDYYSAKMPLQPSLLHFIKEYRKSSPEDRKKLIKDYAMMQDMRMSIYDFADVAYDTFLLNGQTKCHPWTASVQVGDIVRLRFIGAGGSTIFRVKIPGASMTVVHMQGKDLAPYKAEDFTIAPGETLDVLVKIEKDQPYIIYAESSDSLGAAVGVLLIHPHQKINVHTIEPFPTPQPVTMGHDMEDHDMGGHTREGHKMMDHAPSHTMNHQEPESLTKGTKYQNVKAAYPTNDPSKPVQVINMALEGEMERFNWLINGLPEYLADPILIESSKRYRLVFTNSTMMNHPMHFHGHFMILRNGHGAYDPYIHTIDVPPNATAVADFDADESGQWYFHCHHLYHMGSGMARVFRYATFLDDYKKKHPEAKELPDYVCSPEGHYAHFGQATFVDIGVDPYRNVQKGTLNFLIGWDYHKLQLYSEDAEIRKGKVQDADLDIFYWHPISELWAIKGGANYFYKPSKRPYWQPGIGIEGTLPYFVETNFRTYLHQKSVKFDLQVDRDSQITGQFFVRTGLRGIFATKSVRRDEIGSGLNEIEYILRPYIVLAPGLALFTELNYTRNYGSLKKILRRAGESPRERSITLGTSLLF